jgi:hypothetical protein
MRLTILMIAVLAIMGCSPGKGPGMTPGQVTFIVDKVHFQVQHADGTVPQVYVVPAGTQRFTVDSSQYEFQSPTNRVQERPDSLLLMFTDGRIYDVPLSSNCLTQVSESTASPMGSAPPFSGLKRGDVAVILIGIKEEAEGAEKEKFTALWHGRIEVQ